MPQTFMFRPRFAPGLVLGAALLAAACASKPKASSTMVEEDAPGAPYENVLVIALFESFDARRYLEKEIVAALADGGVQATPLTSMTDTRSVINRDTVVDAASRTGADAVLVTQLVGFEATGKQRDARAQATYNVWPTYWYNVFEVQLTEYVEPPYTQWTNQIALMSELYAVETRGRVWYVQTDWKFKKGLEPGMDYSVVVKEANAIVASARRDGMVVK